MDLIQYLLTGLASGCLYSLMALGLVIVMRATHVVNFAHGQVAMICTFVAFSLLVDAGLSWWLAIPITLIFGAALGVVLYWATIRPIVDRATPLQVAILTLGMFLAATGIAGIVWGYDLKTFPSPVSDGDVALGSVSLANTDILNIVVAVALLLIVSAFLRWSIWGRALTAVSINPLGARLMGISVVRMHALAWAIGAVLAAVAGILSAPRLNLSIDFTLPLLVTSFLAMVVGGMYSLTGAVVGGLIVGVVQALTIAYISPTYVQAVTFALILVFLLVRPTGLFKSEIDTAQA